MEMSGNRGGVDDGGLNPQKSVFLFPSAAIQQSSTGMIKLTEINEPKRYVSKSEGEVTGHKWDCCFSVALFCLASFLQSLAESAIDWVSTT